jgi:ATP-dependent metalloprotease FtsH
MKKMFILLFLSGIFQLQVSFSDNNNCIEENNKKNNIKSGIINSLSTAEKILLGGLFGFWAAPKAIDYIVYLKNIIKSFLNKKNYSSEDSNLIMRDAISDSQKLKYLPVSILNDTINVRLLNEHEDKIDGIGMIYKLLGLDESCCSSIFMEKYNEKFLNELILCTSNYAGYERLKEEIYNHLLTSIKTLDIGIVYGKKGTGKSLVFLDIIKRLSCENKKILYLSKEVTSAFYSGAVHIVLKNFLETIIKEGKNNKEKETVYIFIDDLTPLKGAYSNLDDFSIFTEFIRTLIYFLDKNEKINVKVLISTSFIEYVKNIKAIIQSISSKDNLFIKEKFFFVWLPKKEDRKEIFRSLFKDAIDAKLINFIVEEKIIEKLSVLSQQFTGYDCKCLFDNVLDILNCKKNNNNNNLVLELNEQVIVDAFKETISQKHIIEKELEQKNKELHGYDGYDYSSISDESILSEKPTEKFDSVAGNEYAKLKLNHVLNYIKNTAQYDKRGIKMPKGMILSGPPGCGKTSLGRALAGEANVPFIYVNGANFASKWLGESENNMRRLFQTARACAPCIIFIDEMDAFARARPGGGEKDYHPELTVFLSEVDGLIKDNLPIFIIGATNRPEVLDSAIKRSGRLEEHITCSLPTLQERKEIARIHSKNKIFSSDLSYEYIARKTNDFSGADIEKLINSSAQYAFDQEHSKIELEDFNNAYEDFTMGHKMNNISYTEKQLYETAIHEMGHVFGILFQNKKNIVYSFDMVSIVPRIGGDGMAGATLGVTHYIPPDNDLDCLNENELKGLITTNFGGMAAEEMILGYTTTGVSNDVKTAKSLALKMVTKYGMAGTHLVDRKDEDIEVTQEVEKIIKECYEAMIQIIKNNRKILIEISKELLKKTTMNRKEIEEFIFKN